MVSFNVATHYLGIVPILNKSRRSCLIALGEWQVFTKILAVASVLHSPSVTQLLSCLTPSISQLLEAYLRVCNAVPGLG